MELAPLLEAKEKLLGICATHNDKNSKVTSERFK